MSLPKSTPPTCGSLSGSNMKYKFEFDDAECQALIAGLGELPAKASYNLINKIATGQQAQQAEEALRTVAGKEPEAPQKLDGEA